MHNQYGPDSKGLSLCPRILKQPTDRELEVKFDGLAEGILSPARTRTAIDACWRVETLRSAADLICAFDGLKPIRAVRFSHRSEMQTIWPMCSSLALASGEPDPPPVQRYPH